MNKPGLSDTTRAALCACEAAAVDVQVAGNLLFKSPAADHLARLARAVSRLHARLDDVLLSCGLEPAAVAELCATEDADPAACQHNLITFIRENS